MTKIRKKSVVYIHEAIIPLLDELMGGRDPDRPLYDCTKDKFYERYYHALEVAGVRKLTPYSCRHTTATALAITEGIAPQTVQKIMRWSMTKMLDRYAHPDDDAITDALNSIAGNGVESC